ncbi:MAG TPA: EmrA/EmrK family multidrug efflux transporter periplasmic adaptor subunit, partial [Caulobacteraceae bacterium]
MPDTAEFRTEATHAAPAPTVRRPSLRSRLFALLGVGVALVAIVWFGWWFVVGQFHVTTDNAYVDADVADITPLVPGPVVQVLAVDTQAVRAGQPL